MQLPYHKCGEEGMGLLVCCIQQPVANRQKASEQDCIAQTNLCGVEDVVL
jgi:hypothetical protein